MGKTTGFKEFSRTDPFEHPPEVRVKHSKEFLVQLPTVKLQEQGARCMDCGIPFCHSACPLGNHIPEWNNHVYQDDWNKAFLKLEETNNFPEITGRICPAPCEKSCVLAINDAAVTIKNIEQAIADRAFTEKWLQAKVPTSRNDFKVAIIGSGPAGLACAQQLNSVGYDVSVYERTDKIGGMLRYGIPDFKLDRAVLDYRVDILSEEGIKFFANVNIGQDISIDELKNKYDAVVIAIGAYEARNLNIPGRDFEGIHFAMEFLAQQNSRVAGEKSWCSEQHWWFGEKNKELLATDKDVIVIGGGDSGSDCIGTANRQKAKSVTQFEWKSVPAGDKAENDSWPYWPMVLRTSSSHKEGCERQWGLSTVDFVGKDGKVIGLNTVDIKWKYFPDGSREMERKIDSEKFWPADLVLIASGFSGVEKDCLSKTKNIELSEKRTIKTNQSYMTTAPGIFSCGDARRGQSLVVWAISEGRETAREIDIFLRGKSKLPAKGEGDL